MRGIAGGGGGHALGVQVVDEAGRHDEEGGGADRPGVDVHLSVRPPQTPSQILLAERAGQPKPVEFCAVMSDILQYLMCWCRIGVAA